MTRTHAAETTYEALKTLGVLKGLKNTASRHVNGTWEIWGHFQNNEGRKNAKIATFDDVESAIDFEVLAMGGR